MKNNNFFLLSAAIFGVLILGCTALTCQPGYVPNVVYKYCQLCLWGHYCPDGINSYLCQDGSYSSTTGATTCAKCPEYSATDYEHTLCFPTLQNVTSIVPVLVDKLFDVPIGLEADKTTYVHTTTMVDKTTKCLISGVSYDADVSESDITVFVENGSNSRSLIQLDRYKTSSLKKGIINPRYAVLDISTTRFDEPRHFYFKIDSTSNASKVYLKVDHFVPDNQVIELKNGTMGIKLAYQVDSRLVLNLDSNVDAILVYLSISTPVMYASFTNEFPTVDFHDAVSRDGMLKITKDLIPAAPAKLYLTVDEHEEASEDVKITTILNPSSKSKQLVFNN